MVFVLGNKNRLISQACTKKRRWQFLSGARLQDVVLRLKLDTLACNLKKMDIRVTTKYNTRAIIVETVQEIYI